MRAPVPANSPEPAGQQQQQQPGELKPGEQSPTPNEEIRTLRDRLAKLETERAGVEARREAELGRDDFIRETYANAAPGQRDLFRKFAPATTNRDELHAASRKFDAMVKEILDHEVANGQMRWVNVGPISRDGGTPTSQMPPRQPTDPVTMITQGLAARKSSA